MPARPGLTAEFVDSPNGRLFLVGHLPVGTARARLLLLPAFGEEMNRARPTMAALARALAGRGIATFLADLGGTGDSDGAFGAASWSAWLTDIDTLRAHLAREDGPLRLGGLRSGALLAAQAMADQPDGLAGLDLIQPLRSGDSFLKQLLRLRVAAAMARGERERGNDLMARFEAGESLVLGGYRLAPALALGLAAARLEDAPPPAGLPVRLIEIAAEPAAGDDLAARLPVSWQGGSVRCHGIAGAAFWSLAEAPVAHDLVDRLAAIIADAGP